MTLTTAMAVLSGVGTVVGAVGSVAEGSARSRAAKFNAKVQEQQAQREREIADLEATQFRREQRQLQARSRVGRAASGVRQSGSALLVDDAITEEILFNEALIRAGGETRATALENSAMLSRLSARNSLTGGLIRAGGSLLSAGSSFDTGTTDVPAPAPPQNIPITGPGLL